MSLVNYLLRRSLAYLVDSSLAFGVVMLLLQWAILLPVRDQIGLTDEWMKDPWHMQGYVFFSISIPVWLYFAFFERSAKGTPGKRLFSLLITKSNAKQNLGFGLAFIRTLFKLLPWELAHVGVIFPRPLYFNAEDDIRIATYAGIILLAVYFISIMASARRKSLYDQILGTMVSGKNAK